jgi:hypothetical protein
MSYTQTFQLLPADGAYYVFNDLNAATSLRDRHAHEEYQ